MTFVERAEPAGSQTVRWNRAGSEQEKEAITPGLWWEDAADKEVVSFGVEEEMVGSMDSTEGGVEKKKRRWLWILVPVIALVLLGVIAGTTVGIILATKRQPGSGSLAVPSMSAFKSKSGTYNGTDMAVTNPGSGADSLWIFYQDYTGDVKLLACGKEGTWQSSQSLGLKDVANGTAIAAITYDVLGSKKVWNYNQISEARSNDQKDPSGLLRYQRCPSGYSMDRASIKLHQWKLGRLLLQSTNWR